MKRKYRVGVVTSVLTAFWAGPLLAQTQLANPSFEEDVANIGNPDGWGRDQTAKVKVVHGNASTDASALQVTDGYIVASQELNIPEMAGQTVRFSIDAKGETDDAMMGVRIGFINDGQWTDVPLIWERKLTRKYEEVLVTTGLPPKAAGGRLYLGIYRNAGSFFLDNVQLQVYGGLPTEHAQRAVALTREATYTLNRIKAAGDLLPSPQKTEWSKKAEKIAQEGRYAKADLAAKLDGYESSIQELNIRIFRALGKEKKLSVNWASPFVRLAPDAIPAVSSTAAAPDILALRGEHQAVSLDIANTGDASQNLGLQVQGLPAGSTLTWRRQVFTETWYEKGAILLSDPMTKLASQGDSAWLSLSPGEMARLYADIKIPAQTRPGTYKIQVKVLQGNETADIKTLTLRVSAKAAPPRHMAHYAFAYLITPVVAHHTAEAVQDLVAHGVTDIEWANRPPAKYDMEGNLLSVDWSFYDNMLLHFGPTSIRLNTFWPYPPEGPDGKEMKRLSPAWKNALEQLLRAWIEHAAGKGVSSDRITLLIQDEVHSMSLESSPSDEVKQYVGMTEFFKEKFPEIKNYLTLTYFAFAPDAKAVIPVTDVMMPYLPMPDDLPFNAPPTYNPRLAFAAEVDPALRAERDKRGMQLWSYHVAPGRSSNEFWNRAYPLEAAVTGHTGIGFWAYDVSRGKTWDDTDGGLLDYNFVHDGTEDHPLAKKWNVTGEGVVPSIRWEAVRAGLQDADIFLDLQAFGKNGKLNAAQRQKLDALLKKSSEVFLPSGRIAEGFSHSELDGFSRQMRELYVSLN